MKIRLKWHEICIVAFILICSSFTFEVRRSAGRREREGEDPAFSLRHPSSPLDLVFILPLWPLTFQLPDYKKNEMQPEMARDIQKDWAGVTWRWAARERAKSDSVNDRERNVMREGKMGGGMRGEISTKSECKYVEKKGGKAWAGRWKIKWVQEVDYGSQKNLIKNNTGKLMSFWLLGFLHPL